MRARRQYSFFTACALHFVAGLEIYYKAATLYVSTNIVGDDVLGVPLDANVTFSWETAGDEPPPYDVRSNIVGTGVLDCPQR